MKLYTSMLNANDVFKNYRNLCEYLKEQIKTGKSKQLQLKEWERYFSFKKEGQKIIITEVFEEPKEKIVKTGGNIKNVRPMMDYIMSTFNTDYLNKYYLI